jgi:hypothetical protein
MFDDDDPYLDRLRGIASTFPGSAEKVSHGRPAFYTAKVFAYYGGSIKVDGVYVQHAHAMIVLPDSADRRALLEEDRVFLPAYLAPAGWIGVDLDAPDNDWDEVGELLDASFRLTAPKRLVRELDERS